MRHFIRFSFVFADYRKNLALAAELPADLKNAGMPKKGLPTYSLSEVAKHTTK